MSTFNKQIKKNEFHEKNMGNNLDIGLCVKIENSKKTFQVVGLNSEKSVCWIRELPLKYEPHKTFALSISQIMASTICPSISTNEDIF